MRNEVLIAKKDINPGFFEKYFEAYEKHLKNEYKKYKKPSNNNEATKLANQITNSTSSYFFLALPVQPIEVVTATFGNWKYGEAYPDINVLNYLKHEHIRENSSTWMPDVNLVRKSLPTMVIHENSNNSEYLEEVTDQSLLTLALKEKYKLNFKAYVKENFYVDCLLQSNKNDNLFTHEKTFNKNGIKTHYTFFKGHNHLVIENVNVSQVSNKIHHLIK
jgi:hypothetical protein